VEAVLGWACPVGASRSLACVRVCVRVSGCASVQSCGVSGASCRMFSLLGCTRSAVPVSPPLLAPRRRSAWSWGGRVRVLLPRCGRAVLCACAAAVQPYPHVRVWVCALRAAACVARWSTSRLSLSPVFACGGGCVPAWSVRVSSARTRASELACPRGGGSLAEFCALGLRVCLPRAQSSPRAFAFGAPCPCGLPG
jgi:hypothetical protein